MNEKQDQKVRVKRVKFRKILSLLLVFAIGIMAGLFLQKQFLDKQYEDSRRSEIRLGDYDRLTNPLLECAGFAPSDRDLVIVKYELIKYINKIIRNKEATHVSVYIRDLNNGPWIGIDEKEEFAPASLLKVPIMMSYFKIAEKTPEYLNRKIKYKEKINELDQNIMPKKTVQLGHVYTVEDLIYRMIVYSDNEAKDLLVLNTNQNDLERVYADLHITIPAIRTKDDFISIRDYSSFFRILYNASYLNREMSERALEILTQVDFRDGLLAGLPSSVKVAHKFAERGIGPLGLIQLHDCGIVYYDKSPYVIGVMTRGDNLDSLKGIIRDISKITYDLKARH